MSNKHIICFLGIDGSGKSTLSLYLNEKLEKRHIDVSHTWWLEGENSLVRRCIRKIFKNNASDYKINLSSFNNHETKPSLRSKLFKIAYPNIVILDYLRFGITKTFLWRFSRNDKILIFDRYFYDVIMALASEFNLPKMKISIICNIFKCLIPEPDVIFFIDVPPEVAYTRKMDEIPSLNDSKMMRNDYTKLLSTLKKSDSKIFIVENTKELEHVKCEIAEIVFKLLE
jgi:thymidylate kinase